MTAPIAPVLSVNQDGHVLYARWQPVPDAATYRLYVAEGHGAPVLVATLAAEVVNADGWFFRTDGPHAGPVVVTVTAVNAGAEESVPSNERRLNLRGAGAQANSPQRRRQYND